MKVSLVGGDHPLSSLQVDRTRTSVHHWQLRPADEVKGAGKEVTVVCEVEIDKGSKVLRLHSDCCVENATNETLEVRTCAQARVETRNNMRTHSALCFVKSLIP